MRTTVNIDDPVLRELKQLQAVRGTSLGRLISELLVRGLRDLRTERVPASRPNWASRDMGARVDLADKEALAALLDRPATAPKQQDSP